MYELKVVRERRQGYGTVRRVQDAGQVYQAFRQEFEQLDREVFVALLLDGKNQVLGFNIVSVGSLTAALVHPREVFKPAILANAAALILAHNHPSGDPEPSAEDKAITERLRNAADLMGIKILDHVVIGDGTFRSFAEDRSDHHDGDRDDDETEHSADPVELLLQRRGFSRNFLEHAGDAPHLGLHPGRHDHRAAASVGRRRAAEDHVVAVPETDLVCDRHDVLRDRQTLARQRRLRHLERGFMNQPRVGRNGEERRARSSVAGTGNTPVSSAGAGGSPVSSRTSCSLSVSRDSKAWTSVSSCLRWMLRRRLASSWLSLMILSTSESIASAVSSLNCLAPA